MRRLGRLVLLLALLGLRVPALAQGNASVRVVRVAVPDAAGWDFAVTTLPGIRLLGGSVGVAPQGVAPLLLSLQIGGDLRAGRQTVGQVTFTRGAERRESPITVEIAARHALQLDAAAPLRVVTSGEEVELRFTLQNGGNGDDSVAVILTTPQGWGGSLATPAKMVVPAQQAAFVRVTVRVPTSIRAGGGAVAVRAVGSQAEARAETFVEVGTADGEASRGGGLVMTTGITQVTSATGSTSLYGVTFGGEIANGITLSGTAAPPLRALDVNAVRGAALVGGMTPQSQLRLSHARGSLDVGQISLRLPELAGRAVGGTGAAVAVRMGGTLGIAAVRDLTSRNLQGALTWSDSIGRLNIDAAVARLSTGLPGTFSARELTASSLGLRIDAGAGVTVAAEAADRVTSAGRSFGISTDLAWTGTAGRIRLRAQHAPGGAAALAMVRDLLSAESAWRIGDRWNVTSSAWRSADAAIGSATGAIGEISASGASIASSRRIGTSGEVALNLATSGYQSASTEIRQGNRDDLLSLRIGADLSDAVQWTFEAGNRRQVRETRTATVRSAVEEDRLSVNSSASFRGVAGTLALTGGYSTATATQASELGFSIRGADLRPIRRLPWLSAEGDLQRRYLGFASVDQARLALRAALRGQTSVVAGVERSAWTGGSIGLPSQTVFAIRFERTSTASVGAQWRGRSGFVFEDRDDDGARDADEPLVPGVTLRSQTDVVTTDRNGRFRLPGDAVPPQIDVRTLGMDQRPGATPVNPWEIPIRTVGRLAVAIRRTQVTTVSQVASNATVPVVVTARDSVGREWRVVAGRDGIARFDALPLGAYVVSAASSEPSRPVRVEDVAVAVTRGSALPGAQVAQVTLIERDRTIRLQGVADGLGVNALLNAAVGGASGSAATTTQKQQQLKQQQQQQQRQQQQ